MRRVFAQVFMRGVRKETLIDEAADDRESAFQDRTERRKGVIAINSQARRRVEAVAADGADERGSVAAEYRSAELQLHLKQIRHGNRPALAHAAPRSTGFRAREDWCPTRSRWAQRRSAAVLRRRGPRRVALPESRGRRSGYPNPRRRDGRRDGSRRLLSLAARRDRRSGRTGSLLR